MALNLTGLLDYSWISFLIMSACSPSACRVSSPDWNTRREDTSTPAASLAPPTKLTTKKPRQVFLSCSWLSYRLVAPSLSLHDFWAKLCQWMLQLFSAFGVYKTQSQQRRREREQQVWFHSITEEVVHHSKTAHVNRKRPSKTIWHDWQTSGLVKLKG